MIATHPLWLVLASFALALAPILLGTVTSYIKVSIVLTLLRSGLGTQSIPGALVVMALSMGISLYVMAPTWDASVRAGQALPLSQILSNPSLDTLKALVPVAAPWREFMQAHAGERELAAVSSFEFPENPQPQKDQPGWRAVMLAFMLTELRQAFCMGFVLLLPFLVIDLVVANVLVGLGMFMVTPSMISLPLKLMLFVVTDGWILLSRGLIHSY
ncbi:MAG: EscR/YscR/HrcR family type III secretion system export apparatus protein [Deltaproteobacteria bacterium]|nr:EscR/YscR/HrcR family type III secretion system export apparatus protein [Deltaproteobacteria bacterium]